MTSVQSPFTSTPFTSIDEVLQSIWRHPLRWATPAVLGMLLSLAYLPLYQPTWTAHQALTIRDEASSRGTRLGRFENAEDLKHAQETIVELALNRSVVAAALEDLGPPDDGEAPQLWPSAEDVENARSAISLTPPNGAEFGTTELFYLNVKDKNRDRAIRFATVLTTAFEARLTELRDARLQSILHELEDAVELARRERTATTDQLTAMEASVGDNLAELRSLNNASFGSSDLQSSLIEVRQELRSVQATVLANQQLLELLSAAREDPTHLIATPNQLLEAQPALQRLKEGLVDAQISTSQLLGTMSPEHPRVLAAEVAEQEIQGHLHRELELAIGGLRAEQRINEARIESLSTAADRFQRKLEQLASIRAQYGNLVAESEQRTTNLMEAEQDLAEARASQAAIQNSSLLTRIDTPQTGPRPSGPGRTMIVAAGSLGGLLLGFGIVFLTATANPVKSVDTEQLVTNQASALDRHTSTPGQPSPRQPSPGQPSPSSTQSSCSRTVRTMRWDTSNSGESGCPQDAQ
jgi:succinoglycan biosynthesis transport protein ExoP